MVMACRHSEITIDNRWVVPFNPWLSLKYDAHINVEICCSIVAIKYLYKYVYKGHDRAEVTVREVAPPHTHGATTAAAPPHPPVDEIKQHQDGRYVSAPEACHRLYGFSIHREEPNVYRLDLHLPDEQRVTFAANADLQQVLQNATRTKLTEWMAFNHTQQQRHAAGQGRHACLDTLYHDFPAIATWQRDRKAWTDRKQGGAPVGRMYFVHPSAGERYYLRILLHHVPGVVSWEDLRTTNRGTAQAVVHPTFKAACIARGLLEDDNEWHVCLSEAAQVRVVAIGHPSRPCLPMLHACCHVACMPA